LGYSSKLVTKAIKLRLPYKRQIKKIHEGQFSFNPMKKDEIEKKNQLKRNKKQIAIKRIRTKFDL